MELRELFVTLRKGWIFILVLVALGAGAGVLFAALSPKVYQASTQLFVSASVPTTDGSGTAGAALAAGNTFTQDRVQSYVQIANSPRAMTLALKNPDDFNTKIEATRALIAAAPAAKTAADAALTAATADRDAKAAAAAAAVANADLTEAEKKAAQDAATAATTAFNSATTAATQADGAQERYESSLAALLQQQETYGKVQALGLTASELARKVEVTAAKDTVLLNITVQDGNPDTAALLAGAVGAGISEFIESTDVTDTKSSGANSSKSNVTLTITRDPAVPQKPASPNRLLDIAVGVLLGLVVGVGLVFLRGAIDNTVKTAADFEALGVPVLGFVPTDKRSDRSPIAFRADAHSPRSEAYRSIRTNMQFLDVDNPPRIIAVTSAVPAEGKSTTAINLAAALAEAGYRVCLVDADLRRPSIGATLGLINDVGLTTAIVGDVPVEDVLQNAGRNLAVLTSGKIPPNPSELLLSSHAKSIILDLAERVDFIIIDTPPLLPVTDAAELAALVDATVLVHRYGKTTKEQAARSVSALSKVGTKPVGVILNMVNPGRGKSTDAYGYYYTYRPTQRKDRHKKDAAPAVEAEATPTAATPAIESASETTASHSLVGSGPEKGRDDS